jgi:hypothetical protein
MLVIMALRLWSGSLLGFEQGLLLLTRDPGDALSSPGAKSNIAYGAAAGLWLLRDTRGACSSADAPLC